MIHNSGLYIVGENETELLQYLIETRFSRKFKNFSINKVDHSFGQRPANIYHWSADNHPNESEIYFDNLWIYHDDLQEKIRDMRLNKLLCK